MYVSQAGKKNILYYLTQNNWFSSQDVEPQENYPFDVEYIYGFVMLGGL